MGYLQDLPETPYDGLDDSAYKGAADVAGAGIRTAMRWAAEKTGIPQKLRRIGLIAAAALSVILIAVLLLYGAGEYLGEKMKDWWEDFRHRNVDTTEDDYIPYYDQAGAMLEAVRDGVIDIRNDMVMLSKEDFIMILEYVVRYNDDLTYNTYPERIRYEVSMRDYTEVPATSAGPRNDSTMYQVNVPMQVVPKLWETKKRYQTVSYSTIGQNYYNPCTGENSFDVSWQTITVLCEMMAENNHENFGSDIDGWKSRNYADY